MRTIRSVINRRCDVQRAFTLIELVGVLAVGAILFSLVAPALMHELDRTARTVEVRRVRQVRDAFRDSIQRLGWIPDAPSVPGFVAPALGWRVADVATNGRGIGRAMIVDPGCRLGMGSNQALPFVQTWEGSVEPEVARVVLLSSLGEPLPGMITNGAIVTTEAFESLWRAAPETIPEGWSWTGQAEDLVIERLDLGELFVSVTLNNTSTGTPRVAVSATNAGALGPGTQTPRYLRGTALRLFGEEGLLQSVEVLQEPASWQYSGGKWRRTAVWNPPPHRLAGRDFEELADAFRRAPANPHAPPGAPARALTAMTNFAAAYQAWADAGFGALSVDSIPFQAWRELEAATVALQTGP